MAIKDVENYYNEISNQYVEMLDNLKEASKAVEKQLVSPDWYKQLEEQIQPLKENYMRISYIMFLLNKPSKLQQFINKILAKFNIETKSAKLSKKIDETATLEAVKEENQKSIDSIKV